MDKDNDFEEKDFTQHDEFDRLKENSCREVSRQNKFIYKLRNICDNRGFKLIVMIFLIIIILIIAAKIFIFSSNKKVTEINNLKEIEMVKSEKVNKQKIKESVENILPYEKKLLNNTINKNTDTKKFNKNGMEIKKYVTNLENYKKAAITNLAKVEKIICPKESEQYKTNIVNEYKLFIDGLTHEINYINNKDLKESTAASNNYNSFMKIKDSNKILLENTKKLYK